MVTQNFDQIEIPKLVSQLLHLTRAAEAGLIRMSFLEPRRVDAVSDVSAVASLSEARLQELVDGLNLTLTELSLLDENATISASERRTADIRQFERFLEHGRLHIKDESIFDLIDEGDILEVYDSRSIQLWRNWAFYKICPYSLFELLGNDWNTLFVRPTWVVDKLMSMMPIMFRSDAKVQAYNIPEYLLSARKFPNSKGMLFKMKFVATIYNHVGQPVAILTTGSLEVLQQTRIGREISFI